VRMAILYELLAVGERPEGARRRPGEVTEPSPIGEPA
jgi:hypothetical protein